MIGVLAETLFAADGLISIGDIVKITFAMLVIAVILVLLWFLIGYIESSCVKEDKTPMFPPIVFRIIRVVFVVLVVLMLIGMLLQFAGYPLVRL